MATITQLKNKLKWCKKQKSYAWAKFYKELLNTHEAELKHLNAINQPAVLESLPPHLVKEFEEMAKALKKKLTCPICLEIIKKGELDITGCGHKYCSECLKQLKKQEQPKCAICKRKIK